MQHLVVPAFVDHLGGLKQLGVLPLHILDQLAAHQHRTMLAMHQGREPPPGDIAIELDPLVGGQPLPEPGAVDVDEVVGDQPAIAFERPGPVDVGRRVPLIDLGLLVEPPHIGVLAIVIMPEVGRVLGLDLVSAFHRVPPWRK